MSSYQDEDFPSGEKNKAPSNELPDEIVLRKDYSCYCTVCECTLNRVKDAIQHAKGKRHYKAAMMKSGKKNSGLKRLNPAGGDDNAKKMKTEETEEERQAREMLSKVFDETFHGGVVALADNYYCKVCRCMIGNNRKNVNQHKEGKSHKLALEKFKSSLLAGTIKDDIPVEDPEAPFEDRYVEKTKNAKRKTVYYCKLCDFRTKERELIETHVKDKNHLDNVHIEEEKGMMAQNEDYYGYQSNYYGEGTADRGRFAEYFKEFMGNRYKQWSSLGNTGYNRAEPHSKKELPFHSGHGITQNTWDHSSGKLTPDQQIEPALVDKGSLVIPQQRSNQQGDPLSSSQQTQAAFLPHIQQGPIPFMQQSQQLPVPFMPPQPNPIPFMPPIRLGTVQYPQSQQTPFPVPSHVQSQQNALQASVQNPEPPEQSQKSDSAFDGLPGFITSETDAEIVIDVIDSLLRTYLKYRLQGLPGSLIKLLRKSSKGEDNVYSLNKCVMNKITEQIFQNTQKQKEESALFPEGKILSTSVSYDQGSSKEAMEESSPSKKTTHKSSVDSVRRGSYNSSETDDSYDRRSYIEDQLKRAFATRSLAGRQHEDSTSKKAKQLESSIVDFIKQCKASVNVDLSSDLFKKHGSSSKEKAVRNLGQTESSAANIYRHYSYDNNEKHRRYPAEPAVNYLSKQYSKKEGRNNESSNIDFTDHYNKSSGSKDKSPLPMFSQQTQNFRKEDRTSKNLHQDAQSVLDLFKKYRGSGTYS